MPLQVKELKELGTGSNFKQRWIGDSDPDIRPSNLISCFFSNFTFSPLFCEIVYQHLKKELYTCRTFQFWQIFGSWYIPGRVDLQTWIFKQNLPSEKRRKKTKIRDSVLTSHLAQGLKGSIPHSRVGHQWLWSAHQSALACLI